MSKSVMSGPSSSSSSLPEECSPPHDGGKKRILVVVTAGGFTNAAPLLELATILASRGYTIDFGTLSGRESWLTPYPFISQLHILGPSVPPEVEETSYVAMSSWSSNMMSSWGPIFETRKFLESSWPDVYRSLSKIMRDPATRPNFILADYWVDAARDMSVEYDVPIALHWPQMPTAMLHAPYIPGTPGLQIEVLTSEYATMWQRIRSTFAIYTSLPWYLGYLRWVRDMRASAGVTRQLPTLYKPDYLCLVNSFFGLEASKDVPPNVATVGPILADEIPPLAEPYTSFLESRKKVLYIALGTHVILPGDTMHKLLMGATGALAKGVIDGIIWPVRGMARKQLNPEATVVVPDPNTNNTKTGKADSMNQMSISSLLSNAHPSILFVSHAPQRALLHDGRVVLFLSHAGPASANEALFAGVPLVTLPVYFDQIQNALRLRDAGVSVPLRKDGFDAREVEEAVARVVGTGVSGGTIGVNVARLQGIARVAARRKYLAADLIEETLVDWDGRRAEREVATRGGSTAAAGKIGTGSGKKGRGMHLQPADGRMPWWKARNWDLWGVVGAATLCLLGVLVALPAALASCL